MSLFPIAEKQIALLGLLLFAWFVFSAATAMLLVALYLPGQGGLSALFTSIGLSIAIRSRDLCYLKVPIRWLGVRRFSW
jgi:hypothetical protein